MNITVTLESDGKEGLSFRVRSVVLDPTEVKAWEERFKKLGITLSEEVDRPGALLESLLLRVFRGLLSRYRLEATFQKSLLQEGRSFPQILTWIATRVRSSPGVKFRGPLPRT